MIREIASLRRESVSAALRVALALVWVLGSACPSFAFRFAWLSDTHVTTDTATPAADLRASVTDINSMTNLEFVLLTGDVTEMGDRSALSVAKSILNQLTIPLHVIPGNHDTKWSESGATDFAKLWGADRFVFDWGGYTFIGMHQGPVIKTADGHWAPEDVRWLDNVLNRLSDPGRPLIFVTHYPIDNQIDNWYEVLDRLKQYNTQIALVGHGHANATNSYEKLPGIMCRSNLRGGSAVGGYNLVEVTNSQITVALRTPGQSTGAPWVTLPLGPRNFGSDTNRYARPSYSINTNYPTVVPVWQFSSGYLIASTPAIWKDTAIIGDASGTVYSLRLDRGTIRWKFRTQDPVYSTPDVAGDIVVFGSTDGAVYALEAANGREIWRTYSPRPIVACPRVTDGRVFIGSSDGKFRAFDVHTGKTLWTFAGVPGFVETRPLVYQGKVIFGAWDGYLYALDAANGRFLWKWIGSNPSPLYAPAACWPVATDNKVFIAAPDRWFTAISATTGQTVWRTNTWTVRESVGLSEDGQRIYARTMTDYVVAVSSTASQPQQVWLVNAGFGTDFNPAQLVERDGTVFYGTKNGVLVAMNPLTGVIQWQYKLGPTVLNTVVPLGGGRVLVPDFDGRVTVLQGPGGK